MKSIGFSGLLALLMFSVPAAARPIDWANGAWGIETAPGAGGSEASMSKWRNCGDSPVLIKTDRANKRYESVLTGEDDYKRSAPILAETDTYITIQYDGEKRLMKDGKPQIWHMYFVSPDKFYWIVGYGIRADQRDGIVPQPRVRCILAVS